MLPQVVAFILLILIVTMIVVSILGAGMLYLNTSATHSQMLANKLKFLSFKTIKGKLAQYLLALAGPDRDMVELPLTQNNLAEQFGVARPSLARALGEMAEAFGDRAQRILAHLPDFSASGGFTLTDKDYGCKESIWSTPLIQAPYVYTTLKGLCDYDFMEDAADIGTNWLTMVQENYAKTGELWAWYNAAERSTTHPDGVENEPMLSLTAGVYTEVIDCLGLD